jgi:AraC family transcriptional regulator, transcriptional activator of pobA
MQFPVPSYALYGDPTQAEWENGFSFEWIPSRSSRYQWEIQAHRHEGLLQILFLTKGRGQVQIEQAWHALEAPCAVLVPAGTVHGFRFSPSVDGPVVTVAQAPLEHLLAFISPQACAVIRSARVFDLRANSVYAESLMPLFLELEREARLMAPHSRALGLTLLVALSIQLQRLVGQVGAQNAPGNGPDTRKSLRVQKFRSLLDQHFREHWTLGQYAVLLGLSAGQLSRICRDMAGVPGSQLIAARVLGEAQRELAYGTASIKQIASSLGFQDEAYFSRFFRQRCACSPREFRRNAVEKLMAQQ